MATEFGLGDHVCVLYDTEEEQLTVAAAYVGEGLRNRERCLYVAGSDAALDRFVAMLSAVGVDGREAQERGALLLRTTNPFYRSPEIAATRPAQPGDLNWKLSELRRR